MRIVQLNTADIGGGAERVAMLLHRGFTQAGHDAVLVVGHRRSEERGVVELAPKGALETVAEAGGRRVRTALGIQGVGYPSSRHLRELIGGTWDAAIVHNLHGDYVSLQAVRHLADTAPVVLALHDMWLLTGHCAHAFRCERWRTGCGSCPALDTYPAVRRDSTRLNLSVKRRTLRHPNIRVVSSARWLLELARASHLAGFPMTQMPNAVDTSVFRPGSRATARAALGLPADRPVILFPGALSRRNPFKDPVTTLAAMETIADVRPVLLAFAPVELPVGEVDVHVAEDAMDPDRIAMRYVASDAVAHLSVADTSPLAILEAAACGTPVVATDVGGIPEEMSVVHNGAVVPAGDPDAAGAALRRMLLRPAHAADVTQRTVEAVTERHSVVRVTARWVDLLRSLCGEAAPARDSAAG